MSSVELRGQGLCRDPQTGGQILQDTTGGPILVLVVHFANGTVHAIGVGYRGIAQTPVVFDQGGTPCPAGPAP